MGNKSISDAAKQIKALLFDVDGVLTDGGIIYDNDGNEYKRYNVKDGQIISHLKRFGIITGAITGRKSQVVINRCEELKLDFHRHGVKDKLAVFEEFKKMFGVGDNEIAYVGDDIIDLPLLTRCGLSATPADARVYIKQRVDYVLPSKGGEGALRDFADDILEAQGKLDEILNYFIKGD